VSEFEGEVHPYTAEYPLLPDDELADLASDIAENGLNAPLIVDQHGRLVDGQNRLAACELAGVTPRFERVEFADDAAVAAFVSSRNDRRRSQSAGVRWMRVGVALQRQGKRRNGRWERGSITQEVGLSQDSAAEESLRRVGLVLDVAGRAATLGDEFTQWSQLPKQVLTGEVTLNAAHGMAQNFEAHAAMAELLAYQPLAEWVGHHTELAREAVERYGTPPEVGAPWKPEHLKNLTDAAANYQRAATSIRNIIKERKQ